MQKLQDFINEMRSTSSSTEKVQIIKDADPFIHKVLEYTYNPFKQYYVTSKTCLKNQDKLDLVGSYNLFSILDMLSTRSVTGHRAIAIVNGFVDSIIGGELIYKIIDKNLDIRAGDKVINKVVPDRDWET